MRREAFTRFCYGVSCPNSKRQLIRLRKKFGLGRNRSESSMSDIFGAIQVAIVARVGVYIIYFRGKLAHLAANLGTELCGLD